MKVRDRIQNIRDFEKFLRRNGFSRDEAKVLCTGYRRLQGVIEKDSPNSKK